MDVQTILDTSKSVNASILGSAEASSIFRNSLKNSYKVQVALKDSDKAKIKEVVTFPLVFLDEYSVTNDHAVLAALRGLARDVMENEFHISHTFERTLMVGSAMREIKKYNSNPYIHYYIHGSEGKDYDRIVRPALLAISRTLKTKALKADRRIFLPSKDSEERCKPRPVLKRYQHIQQVIDDYINLHKMPDNIHLKPVEANTLVFEDTIYNYDAHSLVSLFVETGANIAYGYGLFPMELLYPDMAPNNIYNYASFANGFSSVTFTGGGYSNGYIHKTKHWATILSSPIISSNGIDLLIEIVSRMGPMMVFKIIKMKSKSKTRDNMTAVRTIGLTENEAYVKVLDVWESVDRSTGKVIRPLKYFSVRESEYSDTLNYLIALDPKSLTLTNAITYVRRKKGGVSLVNKELVAPWHLQSKDVHKFALAVLLRAKTLHEKSTLIMSNIDVTGVKEKFLSFLRTAINGIMWPISMIMSWILSENLTDELVLYPSMETYQEASVIRSLTERMTKASVGPANDFFDTPPSLTADNENEDQLKTCPICNELHGKLGAQKIKCQHVTSSKVTLSLTDEQIATLKTSLLDNDNDPTGLKNVKERAGKKVPPAGFSHDVTMRYIKGGPGCGKSHIIRSLATQKDLILAPFTKLKADYENIRMDGDTYDLTFKTTHRAMEVTGCKRIFVDEFTSMPYEYLACIAYNNGAEEVILVGDDKQTKVQEPDEGMYIGNHINLSALCTHTLLVNFRNPADTVALLNKNYGYQMEAFSKETKSIHVISRNQLPKGIKTSKSMAFSHASAGINIGDEKMTVRANQGGSASTVILYVSNIDGNIIGAPDLQIVSLSRHTDKLYIVSDFSSPASSFTSSLGLNADFYENMQTYLTFTTEEYTEVPFVDPCVDLVLPKYQPPSDSYLLGSTLLPGFATDPDYTSMNHLESQVSGSKFSSGVLGEDFLTNVNQRGHPTKTTRAFHSAGSGVGLHYDKFKPMQTLAVMEARYLNFVPKYPFGYDQITLARDIVNLWFSEHMSVNFSAFDTVEIQTTLSNFLRSVKEKKYPQRYRGLDNPEARLVRFHLKDIFKPKGNSVFDLFKVGQGISAWDTDVCAMFCGMFRILGKHMIACEKPHVLTDSYTSETDFIQKVTDQFSSLPSVALNGVTDGEMFDAQQNEFTQEIEKQFWLKLGVAENFLDMYYSFRKKYVMQAKGVRGRAGYQKTSGEPGTLVNNGIVSKVLSNFIIRGEGPVGIVYKGDDFNKRQCNLAVNEENKKIIESVCPLKLKVNISEGSEFCGLIVSDGYVFPSITRKLNKIMAHRFRDYQHFCEYQASLRDFTKKIEKLDTQKVIALNAKVCGMSHRFVSMQYDSVISFSHINKDQFEEVFLKKFEDDSIPVYDDDAKFGVLMQ
uniref:Polyprotein n=1 Tax=Bemisia tabaci beny-like virus 6 TaxID=2840013 RepID=A0A8E8FU56_9VIRU|nr:polyprotein [Bemisia tabaci beny-like virus 6]